MRGSQHDSKSEVLGRGTGAAAAVAADGVLPKTVATPTGSQAAAQDSNGLRERAELLLTRLLHAYEAWYDVERDHEFGGITFPGYAEFHSHGEQYVLVKRAKLWEMDSHDYLFILPVARLDVPVLERLVGFMETSALAKVDPKPNHMQSFLSLVVIAGHVDDDAARRLARTHFRKNFRLGIRGWADLRLASVDLARDQVTTNGAGKALAATLEANLHVGYAGETGTSGTSGA